MTRNHDLIETHLSIFHKKVAIVSILCYDGEHGTVVFPTAIDASTCHASRKDSTIMYKICKTEQSAARQRELEYILLEEMLVRHYDEISISTLCEHASIPRKAFYRYFSSKHDALDALIDHTMMDFEHLILQADAPAVLPYSRQITLFISFLKNQKRLLDAIDHSGLWEVFSERITEYGIAEMERSVRYSLKTIQQKDLCSIRFTTGGIMAVVHDWYRKDFDMEPNQLASTITQLIVPNSGWIFR